MLSNKSIQDSYSAVPAVKNESTAVVHSVFFAGALMPPLEWKTRCRRKLAAKPHTLMNGASPPMGFF